MVEDHSPPRALTALLMDNELPNTATATGHCMPLDDHVEHRILRIKTMMQSFTLPRLQLVSRELDFLSAAKAGVLKQLNGDKQKRKWHGPKLAASVVQVKKRMIEAGILRPTPDRTLTDVFGEMWPNQDYTDGAQANQQIRKYRDIPERARPAAIEYLKQAADPKFDILAPARQHYNCDLSAFCTLCRTMFPTPAELLRHTTKDHPTRREMRCMCCGQQLQLVSESDDPIAFNATRTHLDDHNEGDRSMIPPVMLTPAKYCFYIKLVRVLWDKAPLGVGISCPVPYCSFPHQPTVEKRTIEIHIREFHYLGHAPPRQAVTAETSGDADSDDESEDTQAEQHDGIVLRVAELQSGELSSSEESKALAELPPFVREDLFDDGLLRELERVERRSVTSPEPAASASPSTTLSEKELQALTCKPLRKRLQQLQAQHGSKHVTIGRSKPGYVAELLRLSRAGYPGVLTFPPEVCAQARRPAQTQQQPHKRRRRTGLPPEASSPASSAPAAAAGSASAAAAGSSAGAPPPAPADAKQPSPMWVPALGLTVAMRDELLAGRLTPDDMANAVMQLALKMNPRLAGLQQCAVGAIRFEEVKRRPAAQIHHNGRGHWLLSVATAHNEVYFIDSKAPQPNERVQEQLLDIYGRGKDSMNVIILNVQSQGETLLCLVFAAAFLWEFASGSQPAQLHTMRFKIASMAPHLADCLQSCTGRLFPQSKRAIAHAVFSRKFKCQRVASKEVDSTAIA